MSLSKLILKSLNTYKDNTALCGPGGKISYDDLSKIISGIIEIAAQNSVKNDGVVIFYGSDSKELYATLLASCLGNFRVLILNPKTPLPAVLRIHDYLEAQLILTDTDLRVSSKERLLDQVRPNNNVLTARQSNISHITSTSGSMGYPKLICVDSEGLAEFLLWARHSLSLCSDHMWIECGDYTSDMWINNALMAFTSGSKVYIDPQKNPLSAYSLLAASKATHMRSVPQIARLITAGSKRALDRKLNLEFVGLGGDVILPELLAQMQSWVPKKAKVYTTYGCAEIAGFSLIKEVGIEQHTINNGELMIELGSPIEGTAYALSNVNTDGVGDLEILSKQVCVSWLEIQKGEQNFRKIKQPGEVSIHNTGDMVAVCDDAILYHGRKGREIIRNGVRVHLETVEHLLSKLLSVQCVVVEELDRLVLLHDGASQITPVRISDVAAKTIPNFVLPTKVLKVPNLPRNLRGKIDHDACKKLVFAKQKEKN